MTSGLQNRCATTAALAVASELRHLWIDPHLIKINYLKLFGLFFDEKLLLFGDFCHPLRKVNLFFLLPKVFN